MTIKLISFDIWDTLAKANERYQHDRAILLAQAIKATPEPAGDWLINAVTVTLNQANDILDNQTIATGQQFSFKDRIRLVCNRIGTILPDLDMLYNRMSDAFLHNPPHLTEASLPITMASLKDSGFKIAVISNTGFVAGNLLRAMLASIGLFEYIDFGLFSDEIGATSPSARLFAYLQDVSGFSPSEMLHVGDKLDADYYGARTAGLSALLYSPQGEPEDHSIHDLSILPSHPLLTT